MTTIDRRFSDPMVYDVSIDHDDAPDGSDGGYDRRGNYINPDAMKELVHLRSENAQLQKRAEAAELETAECRDAYSRLDGYNARLREAVEAQGQIIEAAQNYMRMYLEPGERRIASERSLMDALLRLYDGPEQRAASEKRRTAIAAKEDKR